MTRFIAARILALWRSRTLRLLCYLAAIWAVGNYLMLWPGVAAVSAQYVEPILLQSAAFKLVVAITAVVAAIRRETRLPIDVHLMVKPVDRIVPDFARAGASIISFQA